MSGWPPTSARRMRSIAFGGGATAEFISAILTPEGAFAPAVTIARHGKSRTPEARPRPGVERVAQPQLRRDARPDRRGPLRKGRVGKGPAPRGPLERQPRGRDSGRNRLHARGVDHVSVRGGL